VPADTPAFIVLRDAAGNAVSDWERGYISIAQGNAWARPGETVTCVGCHFGHVSGSLAGVAAQAEAGWTNIAPFANVTASSYRDTGDPDYQPFTPQGVNDRRGWVPVPAGESGTYQDDTEGWISAEGQAPAGQWVELAWVAPLTVSSVRLVGPPTTGGDWGGFGQPTGPYRITAGTLRLYNGGAQVGGTLNVGPIEPLSAGGTWVTLPAPVRIDRLRFTVQSISGKWWWEDVAALNEIEVLGMAAEPSAYFVYLPSVSQ
jgi:hypothetical protein